MAAVSFLCWHIIRLMSTVCSGDTNSTGGGVVMADESWTQRNEADLRALRRIPAFVLAQEERSLITCAPILYRYAFTEVH